MATFVKRGRKWQAKVRKEGWPQQSETFGSKAEAVAWAAVIESEMARGVFVSRSEAEGTTLAEALNRYREEVTAHKKSHAQERGTVEVWKRSDLACRSLASLRGTDFAKYRDQCLKDGLAPATVRNRLALVSHLFTVAKSEWDMGSLTNPIRGMRKPRADNARDRRLSRQEEHYLFAALDDPGPGAGNRRNVWMPAIVRFALETAMRQEELVKIQWKHIDLENGVARVIDPKNGENRAVPLSSSARDILSALARSIGGRVFPTTTSAIKQSWTRAKERGKRIYLSDCTASGVVPEKDFLDNLWFHDLRHEATSRLVEKGLGVLEVASITGHKDLRMLKRYTHLNAQDLVRKLG
jgi:integrase